MEYICWPIPTEADKLHAAKNIQLTKRSSARKGFKFHNCKFIRDFYEEASIRFGYLERTKALFPSPTSNSSISQIEKKSEPCKGLGQVEEVSMMKKRGDFSSRFNGPKKINPVIPVARPPNAREENTDTYDPITSTINDIYGEFKSLAPVGKRPFKQSQPSSRYKSSYPSVANMAPRIKDSYGGQIPIQASKGSKPIDFRDQKKKSVFVPPVSKDAQKEFEINSESPPRPTYELYQLDTEGPSIFIPTHLSTEKNNCDSDNRRSGIPACEVTNKLNEKLYFPAVSKTTPKGRWNFSKCDVRSTSFGKGQQTQKGHWADESDSDIEIVWDEKPNFAITLSDSSPETDSLKNDSVFQSAREISANNNTSSLLNYLRDETCKNVGLPQEVEVVSGCKMVSSRIKEQLGLNVKESTSSSVKHLELVKNVGDSFSSVETDLKDGTELALEAEINKDGTNFSACCDSENATTFEFDAKSNCVIANLHRVEKAFSYDLGRLNKDIVSTGCTDKESDLAIEHNLSQKEIPTIRFGKTRNLITMSPTSVEVEKTDRESPTNSQSMNNNCTSNDDDHLEISDLNLRLNSRNDLNESMASTIVFESDLYFRGDVESSVELNIENFKCKETLKDDLKLNLSSVGTNNVGLCPKAMELLSSPSEEMDGKEGVDLELEQTSQREKVRLWKEGTMAETTPLLKEMNFASQTFCSHDFDNGSQERKDDCSNRENISSSCPNLIEKPSTASKFNDIRALFMDNVLQKHNLLIPIKPGYDSVDNLQIKSTSEESDKNPSNVECCDSRIDNFSKLESKVVTTVYALEANFSEIVGKEVRDMETAEPFKIGNEIIASCNKEASDRDHMFCEETQSVGDCLDSNFANDVEGLTLVRYKLEVVEEDLKDAEGNLDKVKESLEGGERYLKNEMKGTESAIRSGLENDTRTSLQLFTKKLSDHQGVSDIHLPHDSLSSFEQIDSDLTNLPDNKVDESVSDPEALFRSKSVTVTSGDITFNSNYYFENEIDQNLTDNFFRSIALNSGIASEDTIGLKEINDLNNNDKKCINYNIGLCETTIDPELNESPVIQLSENSIFNLSVQNNSEVVDKITEICSDDKHKVDLIENLKDQTANGNDLNITEDQTAVSQKVLSDNFFKYSVESGIKNNFNSNKSINEAEGNNQLENNGSLNRLLSEKKNDTTKKATNSLESLRNLCLNKAIIVQVNEKISSSCTQDNFEGTSRTDADSQALGSSNLSSNNRIAASSASQEALKVKDEKIMPIKAYSPTSFKLEKKIVFNKYQYYYPGFKPYNLNDFLQYQSIFSSADTVLLPVWIERYLAIPNEILEEAKIMTKLKIEILRHKKKSRCCEAQKSVVCPEQKTLDFVNSMDKTSNYFYKESFEKFSKASSQNSKDIISKMNSQSDAAITRSETQYQANTCLTGRNGQATIADLKRAKNVNSSTSVVAAQLRSICVNEIDSVHEIDYIKTVSAISDSLPPILENALTSRVNMHSHAFAPGTLVSATTMSSPTVPGTPVPSQPVKDNTMAAGNLTFYQTRDCVSKPLDPGTPLRISNQNINAETVISSTTNKDNLNVGVNCFNSAIDQNINNRSGSQSRFVLPLQTPSNSVVGQSFNSPLRSENSIPKTEYLENEFSLQEFLNKIAEKISNLDSKKSTKLQQNGGQQRQEVSEAVFDRFKKSFNAPSCETKLNSDYERKGDTHGSLVNTVLPFASDAKDSFDRRGEQSISFKSPKKRRQEKLTTTLEVELVGFVMDAYSYIDSSAKPLMKDLQRGTGNEQVDLRLNKHQTFSTLTPEVTRFFLIQLVNIRKAADKSFAARESEDRYKCALLLHGLVKAAELLASYPISSVVNSLQDFTTEHQALIIGEYAFLLQKLTSLQNNAAEGEMVHPKVLAFKEYFLSLPPEANDHEVKVLILVPREAMAVVVELQTILGEGKVALIPFNNAFDSQMVLKMIEKTSILVWTSSSHVEESLPWNQFTSVVEWEAAPEHQSPWIEHCLRQNIKTLSLVSRLPKTSAAESSSASIVGMKEKEANLETFIYVASEVVVSNAEMHYVLTSIYNIELIQRRFRDLALQSSGLTRGWPDLVVDERTCVLLQPLHLLRQDDVAHRLLQHLVLLSLQFITVYVILYVKPQAMEGYVYRGNIVRAMVRVVAMCAQFKNEDFFVCPIYAQNYHQIGSALRSIGEACRSATKVWDKEEWTERAWLTPCMSSHEKFLLQFPCINPIAAQIMLTALPLSKLLTFPFEALQGRLPWIPENVLLMFFNLTRKLISFPIKNENAEFLHDETFQPLGNKQPCNVGGGLLNEPSFMNEECLVNTIRLPIDCIRPPNYLHRGVDENISIGNIPFRDDINAEINLGGKSCFGFEEKSTDMFLNGRITNVPSDKRMITGHSPRRMDDVPLDEKLNDVLFSGKRNDVPDNLLLHKNITQEGSHKYFNEFSFSDMREVRSGVDASFPRSQLHSSDNFTLNPFMINKHSPQFSPTDDKQNFSATFRSENDPFNAPSAAGKENRQPSFHCQPSFNVPMSSQSIDCRSPSYNHSYAPNRFTNPSHSYAPIAQPKKRSRGDFEQFVPPSKVADVRQSCGDTRRHQKDIHFYFSPAKRAPFMSSEGTKIHPFSGTSQSSGSHFGRPGTNKIYVGVAAPNPRPGPFSASPNVLPRNGPPPSPKVTFYQNDRRVMEGQDDFKVPKRPQKLIFQRVKGRGGQTILARANI